MRLVINVDECLEVDVPIREGLEQVNVHLSNPGKKLDEVLRLMGRCCCHTCLKNISDELISTFTDDQRRILYDALLKQLVRFRPFADLNAREENL